MYLAQGYVAERYLYQYQYKAGFNVYDHMMLYILGKSNRKAMNRNWSNQKANPALKTKAGNK